MPPIYGWVFAVAAKDDLRLWLMCGLLTVWGARLTYNFARKGGYDPREEDYRWAHVRAWLEKNDPLHPLGRELFSLLFISFYQLLLITLFSVPTLWLAFAHQGSALSFFDVLVALLFLAFVAGETVADQQQWNFQNAKHQMDPAQRQARGGDFARGFLSTGLFRYSRHFNFFCEQCVWWSFYALGSMLVGEPAHWSGLGALLLTLLFQGSTNFTEKISAAKYPAYRDYQRRTSRLLPWFPSQ